MYHVNKISPEINLIEAYQRNPRISDSAFSSVIRANQDWFKGHAQIFDIKSHRFLNQNGQSKAPTATVIELSPYKNLFIDLLISIKRFFTGVKFPSYINDENEESLRKYFDEGRRVYYLFTKDGSQAELHIEGDQKPLPSRIHDAMLAVFMPV